MGSRYLFIVLYVFLEYHLSRGDYRRRVTEAAPRPPHLPVPIEGRKRAHDGRRTHRLSLHRRR